MRSVIVLDTETISIDKPFCYNVGWVILDIDAGSIIDQHDYVVEQHWHNTALFSTAYYANKHPLYVAAMRGKRATMDKWGYIMRDLANDIRKYNAEAVFAFNSPFDDNVIEYNCEWFKTINPLDNIPVLDIRGMVSEFITNTSDYIDFCEEHKLFTEKGHYSTNAENVYRYITNKVDFEEAHTALADALIETDIIITCRTLGADLFKEYKVLQYIPRYEVKPFKVKVDGKIVYEGEYRKKYVRDGLYSFHTKA